jgi:chaperone LolA
MLSAYLCLSGLLLLPGAPAPDPASGPSAPGDPAAERAGIRDETSAEQAVALARKVQGRYARWDDFSADFIQRYTRVALSRTKEQRGKLAFKKPGRFRIEYREPVRTLWVADGERMYVYEPEERQVFVTEDYDAEGNQAAMAFLHGKGELSEAYGIRRLDRGTHGISKDLALLELVPKKDTSYRKLVLGVVERTGEVRETWLFTTGGDINRWILRNGKIDAGVKDARFRFTPPKGVHVIRR